MEERPNTRAWAKIQVLAQRNDDSLECTQAQQELKDFVSKREELVSKRATVVFRKRRHARQQRYNGMLNGYIPMDAASSDSPSDSPKLKHKLDDPIEIMRGTDNSTDQTIQPFPKLEGPQIQLGEDEPMSFKETEREYQVQSLIQSKFSNLNNLTSDWSVRIQEMKTLLGVMNSSTPEVCLDEDSKALLIDGVKVSLALQLTDLRSSLVKEACETIAALAESKPSIISAHAEYFIQAGLNLVVKTIKIMSTSGNNLIRRLIQATSHPEFVLSGICQAIQNQHPVYREHSIQYLLLWLEIVSNNRLVRLLPEQHECIKSTISVAIQDSAPKVRQVAKHVYEKYLELCPQQAKEFYDLIDSTLQKRLDNAKKSEPGGRAAGRPSFVRPKAMQTPRNPSITVDDKENPVPNSDISPNSAGNRERPSSLKAFKLAVIPTESAGVKANQDSFLVLMKDGEADEN